MKGKSTWIIVGVLVLIAIGVFAFKDSLFPKFAESSAEIAAQPPGSLPIPDPPPGAMTTTPGAPSEGRECLVLSNGLHTKDNKMLAHGPGELITVVGVEENGAYYKTNDPLAGTLIRSDDCFLFNDQGLFDSFLLSTSDVTTLLQRSDQTPISAKDNAKIMIINSEDFWKKAISNPKSRIVKWAEEMASTHVTEGKRMAFITELLRLNVKFETPIVTEMDYTEKDLGDYRKLSEDTKASFTKAYCESNSIPKGPVVKALLLDADTISSDALFDEAMNCFGHMAGDSPKQELTEAFIRSLKSGARQSRLRQAISKY